MPDKSVFPLLCTELLRSGQAVRFRATGSSMGQSIREGDIVTVAPADYAQIARGEVVLYTSERGLTAHRVVRIDGRTGCLVTRGDAYGSPEEMVESDAVVGRIESVEREGVGIPVRRSPRHHLSRILGFVKRGFSSLERAGGTASR